MQNLAQYIVRRKHCNVENTNQNKAARRLYNPETDLGPSLFTVEKKYYCSRVDFEVRNRRHKKLKCSLFHHNVEGNTRNPLIVFCHGNSGNRTYSYEIVSRMLQAHFSVLTFDFAGSGLSEGKFISQGFYEQFDIEDVLEYVLEKYPFIDPSRIGLWGRSMGAIAALLFASHNHSVSFIIVDSPFKDFSDILNEYMTRLKIIPNAVARYISNNLRSRILRLSGFDFEELKPIEAIRTCTTPALFHHTNKDRIVPNYHSKDLYKAYPAEKEYLETEGGHNSTRPDEYYNAVLKFINKTFTRRRNLPISKTLRPNLAQLNKNFGEQDCDEMSEYDSELEEDNEPQKSSEESDPKSKEENENYTRIIFPVRNVENENENQSEPSDKDKSLSFMHNESNNFVNMLFNDNDEENFSFNAPVSQNEKLESADMTKDLSKIMSESDLISNSKPLKNIKITPSQTSFLQEICE